MAMYLPHEYQHNRITITHHVSTQEVDFLGGSHIIVNKPKDLIVSARFEGDPIVPSDRFEVMRLIGKSAADALAGYGGDAQKHIPDFWDLVCDITAKVEGFNWWLDLCDRSEQLGFDMDNFLQPPLDVLQIVLATNSDLVFNFINFGETPFQEEDIESAKKLFAHALRGVDSASYDERPNNILIVPSVVAFIQSTDKVIFMDEDIVKRYGGQGEEVLERYSKMVGHCFFGVDLEANVSDLRPPEVMHALLGYDAPWGLRAPTKITLDVVDRS